MEQAKIAALAHQLAQVTQVLDHEREALLSTQSFQDQNYVFEIISRVEVTGATLHKRLVDWHSRYPERPSLAESDAFWSDLKELRAAKEQLLTIMQAVENKEKEKPTLKTQLVRAQNEVGDVERFFSTYLDRVNNN